MVKGNTQHAEIVERNLMASTFHLEWSEEIKLVLN